MKITRIKISNFRLLKSLNLDLERDLSLVIGKNNCGKTSLLSLLEKFLGTKETANPFTYNDFNIDFLVEIRDKLESEESEQTYTNLGICLKLFIEYSESDNLSNISKLMLDLDPKNKTIVLSFEYILLEDDFREMKKDYKEFREKQCISNGINTVQVSKGNIDVFLRAKYKKFFKLFRKSLGYDFNTGNENDNEYVDLVKEKINIDKVINFEKISAKRNVSNIDSDKTLSVLSSKYYKKKEEKEADSEEIQQFKEALKNTDQHLNVIYGGLFEKVIEKVKQFGGIKKDDSIIKIESTLQHRELLKDNTTVMYDHNDEYSLPESYNGLGYLNLISMIFEIELIISDFRKESIVNEAPADINLLFIEEPEAHTHPQMQYIFINNIKDILSNASQGDDGGEKFNLQTIITTHSSHITSESDFDDIKYFFKTDKNQVIAKNMSDLEKEYANEEQYYKFLKQYLTIHRSELFFVDKAIFIEGDTERILLPAMMKKIDQENKLKEIGEPLLSQNISIVEVGAHSHIFKKFINFIGVKSLIITDIDSAKITRKTNEAGKVVTSVNKCKVLDDEASTTTNAALKELFSIREIAAGSKMNELEYLTTKSFDEKILLENKESNQWVPNIEGDILVIYQTLEKNSNGVEYHARSFEDSFFHLNRKFILDNKDSFKSLKNIDCFDDISNDPYFLAEKCVDKKPPFAMDILINSQEDEEGFKFNNWEIPGYLKEGLLWLKNN